MASTPSGSISLGTTLQVVVPAGGNVLSQYTVAVQPTLSTVYSPGTAAGQINKIATFGGSATASPASIDMTTIVCVDGTTGFAHVREIYLINDDPVNSILIDLTVSNAFVAFVSAGTGIKLLLAALSWVPLCRKPIGTNGYVVDSTHKIISLDPSANTIAYRGIICGD